MKQQKNGMAEKRESEKKIHVCRVTEMMQSMEEIRKQQQHQIKSQAILRYR